MIMRLALLVWFLLWARVGFPWRSFQWMATLHHVELIPFNGGSLRSQLLNVLAFIPLGVMGTQIGWHPRLVIAGGFAVSALTEFLQLFSTRRYPSTTDLILNTLGVLMGIVIVLTWKSAARSAFDRNY